PPWTLLAGAGLGQVFLVTADADGAALGVGGALGAQRAVGAGVAELGDPVAGPVSADRDGDPVGARHRVVLGVHIEVVLAEPASGRDRVLGLDARLDVVLVEQLEELAGAVGVVAVHGRPVGEGVLT